MQMSLNSRDQINTMSSYMFFISFGLCVWNASVRFELKFDRSGGGGVVLMDDPDGEQASGVEEGGGADDILDSLSGPSSAVGGVR